MVKMGRPPKMAPIEDRLKMCDMQKEGLGPRVIAREFNGIYHPSHVARLLTKCPDSMASHAGREAVANAMVPAQTISSPKLNTSTNTASSPGATTLRAGWVSSDRNKPTTQKPQVKTSLVNSLGSPAFGDDDESDNDDYEFNFDSLNYDTWTPTPTQTSSLYSGLVNPFTLLQHSVADVFNSGVIRTVSRLSENLSRRLFPNLYPDPSFDAEVQELRDLLDKRDQDMNQTTPNLEKAGACQQAQTCTGYCGVEREMGSFIVGESNQLKDTGISSNPTPDPDQLRQKETLTSDSEQQIIVGKKAFDSDRPILPLEIPHVNCNMGLSNSIATSTGADSQLEQNMTAEDKITELKSFIVTQSNGLKSQSVNRDARPQVETKDPFLAATPPPSAPTGGAIGHTSVSTPAVQPLNDMQTPVMPGVAESQIGNQPPVVTETAKSEFSSVASPVSDVPAEPKATNQVISTPPADNTKQNSNQPPVTSQKSTETKDTKELCERNQNAGGIDTTSLKGKNDVSGWDIVLPIVLGGAAVLGVICLELVRQPRQSSTAPTSETPENMGQMRANFTRVFGPASEPPPPPLYGIQSVKDKIVF